MEEYFLFDTIKQILEKAGRRDIVKRIENNDLLIVFYEGKDETWGGRYFVDKDIIQLKPIKQKDMLLCVALHEIAHYIEHHSKDENKKEKERRMIMRYEYDGHSPLWESEYISLLDAANELECFDKEALQDILIETLPHDCHIITRVLQLNPIFDMPNYYDPDIIEAHRNNEEYFTQDTSTLVLPDDDYGDSPYDYDYNG